MHVPMSVHVPCKYLRLVRQGVIKVVILKELVVNNEMYIIVHFFLIMEFEYLSESRTCCVLYPAMCVGAGCRPRVSRVGSRDPARPSAVTRSQLSAVAARAPAPVRGVPAAAGTSSGGAGAG